MSPNEDQLRAALHDGEGDAPDAGLVIANALRARYERRRTITSIASGVAVVAVVVVGFGLLVHTGSSESGGAAGGVVANRGQVTHGGNLLPASPGPDAPAAASAAGNASIPTEQARKGACPANFPRQLVPGGGGIGQFGSDGPLFAEPVAAARVCEYGGDARVAASYVLGAPEAAELASTLEHASSTVGYACAMRPADEGDLAVYAISASGTSLRVVTVDLGCPYQVTNGTAVRYLTPTIVADLLRAAPSPVHGSPVK